MMREMELFLLGMTTDLRGRLLLTWFQMLQSNKFRHDTEVSMSSNVHTWRDSGP